MNKPKYVYICGIDWQHELFPKNAHPPEYFFTIKDLKKYRPCWVQCGIVRIKLTIDKWVHKQDLRAK